VADPRHSARGGADAGRSARPVARPHRPELHAELAALIDAGGGTDESSRSELAAATAAVVIDAGRAAHGGERFVELADRIGLDTLAALWREAEPVSLPGVLWTMYLLRQWCQSNGDEVARLWRAGEHLAGADAAVAGLADYADADAVRQVADAVLGGAYGGEFDVALERAAALFRVLATGRRELADGGSDPAGELDRANRNDRVAADLTSAALRWRAGTLH
jgi:hypothetical protein